MAKQTIDDCGTGGCLIRRAPAKFNIRPTYPGFNYTTKSEPCPSKRKTCPVQVFFDKGQPKLRFCRQAGSKEPGYTIPVATAQEAQKLSAAACACWAKTKSFKGCKVASLPLGRVRRPR